MEARAGKPEKPNNRVLTTVIGVVGTVAGVTFALYLVGVVFEFRRLKTLGLPTDQAVSSLPHDLLIVIGVRSLVVPVAVALLATVADRLAASLPTRRMRGTDATDWITAAGLAAVGAIAIIFVVEPSIGRVFWEHLGLVAGALLLLFLIRYSQVSKRLPKRRELVVFCAMLIAAVIVAYTHAMHTPVHFDKATVVTTHGGLRQGFYVGRDGSEIFLVPRAADNTTTCPVLDVLLATDVKRIELQRGSATTGGVERDGRCVKP